MTFQMKPIALASLAAASLVAAHAGTLVTGSPVANAELGDLTVSGTTEQGDFSAIPFTFEGGATVSGYCIDPTQDIEPNTTYTNYTQTTGTQYLTPVDNVNLAKLYSENNDLSSATAQAAFQMAVWTASPRHVTSRGRPTLTETSRPIVCSFIISQA